MAIALALVVGNCAFAAKVETLPSTLLRRNCADPWLFRHNGKFYLTQTGSTKVFVLESAALSGFAAAGKAAADAAATGAKAAADTAKISATAMQTAKTVQNVITVANK